MSNGDMDPTKLESGMKTNRRVLVLGEGLTAGRVTHELGLLGLESLQLSTDRPFPGPRDKKDALETPLVSYCCERPSSSHVTDFHGFPGAFKIGVASEGGERRVEEAGAMVIALDCVLAPTLIQWGLAPSPTVWTLSDFAGRLESEPHWPPPSPKRPRNVLFLCGFTHHSYPYTQRTALECGLKLAVTPHTRVIFLLEHFKVAQEGMERMTRKAREKGVLFVRLSRPGPRIQAAGEGVTVTYFDETLGEELTVNPDLFVVEETCQPPVSASYLASVLGVTLDPEGFFQGDQIHNRPIFTNRTGIWVVGTAKGPQSQGESQEEAKAVALEVLGILGEEGEEAATGRIGKNVARCARCLTCYRVCPHRAISHIGDDIPSFSDLACRGCGICAAECPMQAIDLAGATGRELKSMIRAKETREDPGPVGPGGPRILAFACQNSAYESWRHARLLGVEFPEELKLIKVPCAGRVDEDSVLSAFAEGFERVLVLGCHHDSCKSVEGSTRCEQRVKHLKTFLDSLGLRGDRLTFSTTGPGKPFDFVRAYEYARVAATGKPAPEVALSNETESRPR